MAIQSTAVLAPSHNGENEDIYRRFYAYAELGKSNDKVRRRICDLLYRLTQSGEPKEVKSLCLAEVEWIENEYENPNTRTSYVTAYRKAIRAYFNDHPPAENLLTEYKGNSQHCALGYLLADEEDYKKKVNAIQDKTGAQRDNLVAFDAMAVIERTKKALKSDNWKELAAALIMCVQCRPVDILKAGEFKAVSKYSLQFKTYVKKRGRPKTGLIFCLVDTVTFIDAFNKLRRNENVSRMSDWLLKDIDSAKNTSLNRGVGSVYGDLIPTPYGEKELSCKNLRAAGVPINYYLHGRVDQAFNRFAELQLMHENPGTAANYEDYYCIGSNGKRLTRIGIYKDEALETKPLSESRSSLSLDKQLLNMIGDAEEWGEGSHADRLERIITRARLSERLEAQLARECEKRQRLELELSRLKSRLPEVEPMPEVIIPKETQHDSETHYDSSLTAEDRKWRDVPNNELKSDRRHDAYHEKLRRSVEAVQEYNAGKDDSEQFAITGSLLRQLSKVKHALVKSWMEEHKAEIDDYNAGYSTRQNAGKPDPRSVIKWSAAYGEYEW